jgi:hypothetical protein
LIGYFFGKKWVLLKEWLGPTALYLILAGLVLAVMIIIGRHLFPKFFMRFFAKKQRSRGRA